DHPPAGAVVLHDPPGGARLGAEVDVPAQPGGQLDRVGEQLPGLVGVGGEEDGAGDGCHARNSTVADRRSHAYRVVQPLSCTSGGPVLIPTVLETTSRGERAYDIWSRLL